MNLSQDEILKIAKECGFKINSEGRPTHCGYYVDTELLAFANAIQSHSGGEAVGTLNSSYGSDTGWQYLIDLRHDLQTDEYLESIHGHDISLYLANPDQTAKIKELEAERDMIFGLLKQLRATLFNMCNEEKSDLEWIYETNMVMKEIDFMFLHGYLQDSKTELAKLQLENERMRKAICIYSREMLGDIDFQSDEQAINYMLSFTEENPHGDDIELDEAIDAAMKDKD